MRSHPPHPLITTPHNLRTRLHWVQDEKQTCLRCPNIWNHPSLNIASGPHRHSKQVIEVLKHHNLLMPISMCPDSRNLFAQIIPVIASMCHLTDGQICDRNLPWFTRSKNLCYNWHKPFSFKRVVKLESECISSKSSRKAKISLQYAYRAPE